MSNTPRVDEELQRLNDAIRAGEKCGDVAEAYAWEFARQLERELAEARAEIKRLKKNLRLLLCKKHLDKCENGLFNSRFPDDEPCLMCVEEAAERGGK